MNSKRMAMKFGPKIIQYTSKMAMGKIEWSTFQSLGPNPQLLNILTSLRNQQSPTISIHFLLLGSLGPKVGHAKSITILGGRNLCFRWTHLFPRGRFRWPTGLPSVPLVSPWDFSGIFSHPLSHMNRVLWNRDCEDTYLLEFTGSQNGMPWEQTPDCQTWSPPTFACCCRSCRANSPRNPAKHGVPRVIRGIIKQWKPQTVEIPNRSVFPASKVKKIKCIKSRFDEKMAKKLCYIPCSSCGWNLLPHSHRFHSEKFLLLWRVLATQFFITAETTWANSTPLVI